MTVINVRAATVKQMWRPGITAKLLKMTKRLVIVAAEVEELASVAALKVVLIIVIVVMVLIY